MSRDPNPRWDSIVVAAWLVLIVPAVAAFFLLGFRTFVKWSSLVTLVLSLVALAEARNAKREAARGREDAGPPAG